jgi:adenylate kinase
VFDGTPRTVEEAALVDKFFVEQNYPAPLAILLQVDREEMIRRNTVRKFCLGVPTEFPVINEEDAERCKELGGEVGARMDDDPAKIGTRWDEFQKHTKPVADRYRQEGKLSEVDGMRPIEEVHQSVMEVIESLR